MATSNRFRRSAITAAIAAGYAIPAASVAAQSPQSVESPIFVAAYQTIDLTTPPALARSSGGNFVVGWQPNLASAGAYGPAQLMALTPEFTPIGNGVDPLPVGKQVLGNVSLAMAHNGDFVAAWRDGHVVPRQNLQWIGIPYPATAGEVTVQQFAADGTAKAPPVTLGSAYDGVIEFSGGRLGYSGSAEIAGTVQVAMDDDGDYVVGWSEVAESAAYYPYEAKPYGSSSSKTYAAVYRADGSVLQAPKVVNLVKGSKTYDKRGFEFIDADVLSGIAMSGNGTFALLYDTYRKGLLLAPEARYYDLNLTPQSATFSLQGMGKSHVLPNLYGMDASANLAVGWAADDGLRIAKYSLTGGSSGAVIGPIGNGDPLCASTLSVAPSGVMAVTWGQLKSVDLFGTGQPSPSCEKDGQYLNTDGTANGTAFVLESGLDELNGYDIAAGVDGSGNLATVFSTIQYNHAGNLIGASSTAPAATAPAAQGPMRR
jgi:hypothetical protein